MYKKIPRAQINMSAQGISKPKMSKADKYFIRGFACCLSNAISLEDWRPSQIGGGITVFDMRIAGVEESDIRIIERSLEE
jgi:hypothetical protein